VIERLARDVIEVAGPILEQSACLTAADLAAIAAECGGAHAERIAKRLPSAAPSAPAARPGNPAEIAAAELADLFYAADAWERRLILINLDYAPPASGSPFGLLQRADSWRLETAALQRHTEAVVRELERALGISRAQARRIVGDELGEPIVVAAKAVGLPADVLQRILLFMNPRIGQSVDRVYELAELYNEISVEAARRLVAIWRDADAVAARPARHEPAATWRIAADNARPALSDVSPRPPPPHAPP